MPAFLDILEKFFWQFVTLFSEMAPFLLLGFLLAGILHVWVPNHLYVPKISKPNFKSVLWSALFGVPLPICSCGVIPTSIALRHEGASKGASVSFLIYPALTRSLCEITSASEGNSLKVCTNIFDIFIILNSL